MPKDSMEDIMKHLKEMCLYCLGVFVFDGPDLKKNNWKGYIFVMPLFFVAVIVMWQIIRLILLIT